MPMLLELQNLRSGYDGSEVLHSASLGCEEKKITAVLGPNGAGKTTLLKTVLGLIKPTSGNIVFEGGDVTSLGTASLIKRGIGYVPQDANVFPLMTVSEDLRMGGYLLPDKKEVRKRIDEVLQVFPPLGKVLNQKAGFLSGGQRRMLAIGRALIAHPRLLLLDEPSIGLDVGKQQVLFDKLKELNEGGLTILLAEQNAKKAVEVAHFVYGLEGGAVKHGMNSAEAAKTNLSEFILGAASRAENS